jgi:phage tail-like protein
VQLTVSLEGTIVHSFYLATPVLTIGRTPDNDLPLPDPRVSRRHAELRQTPEGTILTDLGSANGTYVHQSRILAHQPYTLTSGTPFTIGAYVFVYEVVGQTSPPDDPEVPEVPEGPAAEPAPPLVAESPPPGILPPPAETAALEATQRRLPLPPPAPPPPPRPVWAPPLPVGPLSAYLRDLPAPFQDVDFLGRYLMILESIWEPLEQRQDHVDYYFDPRTCPPSFLPWLASWLDPAGTDFQWPEERQREVLSRAMDLYRWRGTRFGLTQMIELVTGLAPRITEDPQTPFTFRVQLEVPPEHGVDARLVDRLIQAQKPAHAGYVLEIAVLEVAESP